MSRKNLTDTDIEQLYRLAGIPVVKICQLRGCGEPGEFFLVRVLRGGGQQAGLFCVDHDRQFGRENLRRISRSQG